jgi:hypothetical protein
MIKIICNRKVDMTPDEYSIYQKIVKSYTTNTNRGEDLFIDLFESNNDGIITSLIPPSKRHTTLEVFLFLLSLQSHQSMRMMQREVDDVCQQMKSKMLEIENKLQELSKKEEDQ